MNKFVKPVALLGLAGALTVAAMAPQAEARNGRWGAAGAGFVAGAIIGGAAAAAANNNYYNNGYYYNDGYAYAPGYAYEPAPVYVEPSYSYGYDNSYAYQPAPRYYNSGVNRANNSYTLKERHLNGTE